MNESENQFARIDDPQMATKGGSGAMKIIVIVVLVLVMLGGCCGLGLFVGLPYLMDSGMGMVVTPQVEDTPAIQKYIGTVESVSVSFTETAQQAQSGNDKRIACTISGDKGTGLLLIEQGPSGLQNADWAILEIDGNSYVVFGSPPEDLGAAIVPDTDSGEDTTDDGGTDEASGS